MKKNTLGQTAIYAYITILALFCLLPIILILITSFASEKSITMNGYTFFPTEWSMQAYTVMFGPKSSIPKSYILTIIVTLIGTIIAVVITFSAGYSLANPNNRFRNGLSLYFFITMVFKTGYIPWYLINKQFGLYDNIWALVIPSLMFTPFNMFLVRNFVKGIPISLYESGLIDGADEFAIAFRIYMPLCMPVIATIGLFYGINYWNNYFNSVMLVDSPKLYPLQMLLFKIQSEITLISRVASGVNVNPPKESFKMATCIVTMGPIILLYPALQRFFIKGIVVGAVKG